MAYVQNKRLSAIHSYFKGTIIYISFMVFILFLSGCYLNSPAHTVVITGDLLIYEDNNNLCFEPNLESTKAPFQYETTFIRMDELRVLDANSLSILMSFKPKHKKYLILNSGDKICLNSKNSIVEKKVFIHPTKGQELVAQIGGLDDSKEYYITFSIEFIYP